MVLVEPGKAKGQEKFSGDFIVASKTSQAGQEHVTSTQELQLLLAKAKAAAAATPPPAPSPSPASPALASVI